MAHEKERELLERASYLIGNPGANISGSTDCACDEWQRDYKSFLSTLPEEKEEKKGGKIICYCGSLRFKEQFQEMELRSLNEGNIALLPCCMFVDIERKFGKVGYKEKADEIHKRKIDLADEVYIINPGGYVGESTRNEIEYAQSKGKRIKYYSVDGIS